MVYDVVLFWIVLLVLTGYEYGYGILLLTETGLSFWLECTYLVHVFRCLASLVIVVVSGGVNSSMRFEMYLGWQLKLKLSCH